MHFTEFLGALLEKVPATELLLGKAFSPDHTFTGF
jgi:hypothetical protein